MAKKKPAEEVVYADMPHSAPWSLSEDELYQLYITSPDGMAPEEAIEREHQYGPNELPKAPEEPILVTVFKALRDVMTILLFVSGAVSAFIGVTQHDSEAIINAVLLFSLVLINSYMSVSGEIKAQRNLSKLKNTTQRFVKVVVHGKEDTIPVEKLVPGQIIVLKQGDIVPADARIFVASNAQVSEAALTGEGEPVTKRAGTLPEDTKLAERRNMVFSETMVTSGSITAIVTHIGTHTEYGKIWSRLEATEKQPTPLEKEMEKLAKVILVVALIVAFAIVGISIARGEGVLQALITAVALAVAFIPEALKTVISLALSQAKDQMVERGAIIRELNAAEGAGSVDTVITDKTGTLTYGDRMKALAVWTLSEGEREVNGIAKGVKGVLRRLVGIAHACNDMSSSTEEAIAVLAYELAELEVTADTKGRGRILTVPFSSDRKRMTTVNARKGKIQINTKGAPEVLLDMCRFVVAENNTAIELTDELRRQILTQVDSFARRGLRTLAFADADLANYVHPDEFDESAHELVFVGLVAIYDAPRPEIKKTIEQFAVAGIVAKMATGDNPLTAFEIAKQIGMVPQNAIFDEVVMTGDVFKKLIAGGVTPETLAKIDKVRVFARMNPEDKIDLVQIHQAAGHIVAMAGDGVNDAPSIKAADVGIAVKGATELTQAFADVVLTADYSAIAVMIEVGRTIMNRARLYTHALLSTNGAEVGMFIVSTIFHWFDPFTAVQLLLINLLGDGPLSVALSREKAEPDVMEQQPRKKTEGILTPYIYAGIAYQSILTTGLLALAYVLTQNFIAATGFELEEKLFHTVLFSVFMVQKVLRSAFTARSLKYNIWQIGWFTNPDALKAAAYVVFLTAVSPFIPFLGFTPLPVELLPLLLLGFVPPAAEEVVKFVRQRIVRR